MNEIIENIKSRRSVRAFDTNKKIAKNDLEQIVTAAIYAPSGMNRQSWKFTVVQDQDIIKKLADLIKKELNREDYDFYKPNTLILTSNERDNSNGRDDCSCALENMFLAAHSLKIGSVWINQMKDISDVPEIRAFLDTIKIPQNHIVHGIAALGYALEPPKEKPRNLNVIEWIL